MVMLPRVGSSRPAIMRRMVVLPQPEGPSSVTSVRATMSNETSRTATTSPYCFVTWRNSIEAAFMTCSSGGPAERDHARTCSATPAEASLTDHQLNEPDREQHQRDQ